MSLRSIRTQLTLWNIAILAFILLGCGAALRYRMEQTLIATVDRQLTDVVRPFTVRHPFGGFPGFRDGGPGFGPRMRFRHDSGANTPQRPGEGSEFRDGPGPDWNGGPSLPPNGPADANSGAPLSERAVDPHPGPGEDRPPFGPPPDGMPPPARPERLGEPGIVVLNHDGNGVGRERRAPYDPPAFQSSLAGHAILFTKSSAAGRERIYSVPQRDQSGLIIGAVQSEESLDSVDNEVDDVTRTLLALLPLGLIAAGIGGALLTSRALRPVQKIGATVGRIQAEDLSRRLPVEGRDEFSRLAATLNAMLARLQHAFDEQRRFTMDASHELKTPLAAIKAKTSVALHRPRDADAYKQALETIDRSADRMAETVQDLLLLAQADAGQLGKSRSPVDVRVLVETATDSLGGADGPPIDIDIAPGLVVPGNAGELTRVFRNLIENAVRHTSHSGSVVIAGQRSENTVEIAVCDTGEGVAAEHLAHLTERFYRVDSARSRESGGTGLGLAICKGIVEAHGGRMTIESSVGHGATVRVFLPA